MYPGRLTWLAMEAMGKSVSSLLENLVEGNDPSRAQAASNYLLSMLCTSMPETASNELRIWLLRSFENTYRQLFDVYNSDDHFRRIATEIFVALVHPTVTRIECVENSNHPGVLDGYKLVFADVIYDALPKMTFLETLKLGTSIVIGDKNKCKNLMDRLTDKLHSSSSVEGIFYPNRLDKLKVLHVTEDWFEANITLHYIGNLQRLEELHISSIRTDDVLKLLGGLANFRHYTGSYICQSLKRFSCDVPINTAILRLLATRFPYIISLSLVCGDLDLLPLKSLRNLRNLYIKGNSYRFLKLLLMEIGNHISCLGLKQIGDVEFNHLVLSCPFLSCCHMTYNPSLKVTFSKKDTLYDCYRKLPIPEFTFVHFLELEFYKDIDKKHTEYIISRFPNVRTILFTNCESDWLFDLVTRKLHPRYLEVVFFKKNFRLVVLEICENVIIIRDSNRSDVLSIPSIKLSSCANVNAHTTCFL